MSVRKLSQNNIRRILLLTFLPLFLFACATTPGKKPDNKIQSSASQLYTEGKEALSAEKYDLAIEKFRTLEALYPADPYAQQAQMELAYAYHKNGDATSAIAAADRFIKDNPTHANVDYAYYLRGLTSFEVAIEQLSSESVQVTQRRPLMAQLSLQYLSELVELFPDSKYSSDAARRITFLKDKLAQYEVLLAKNALDNGNYAEAALHAKSAIENYPQAPAIPEAASITNEAYKMLEIKQPGGAMTAGGSRMKDKTAMSAGSQADMATPDVNAPVVIPFKAKEPPEQQPVQTARSSETTKKMAKAEKPAAEVKPSTPEPESEPAPSPDKETVKQSTNGIRQGTWILDQDPNNYTIQLLGTGNEKLLVALIKRLKLTDKTAYYKNSRLDKPWYALTYGTYSSVTEANDAINNLPDELLKGQPWIRKFGDIQPLINNQ